MNDPGQMALDVMEMRAYARAKEAMDNAKKPEDVPNGPMAEMVWDIQQELAEGGRDDSGRNC